MSALDNGLLEKAERYTEEMLKDELSDQLTFHNYDHTKLVVEGARVIGQGENLGKEELTIVELAAWFHDTGYKDSLDNHEKYSATIAKEFLEKEGLNEGEINMILDCIIATNTKLQPKNKLEKVIRDADTYHISKESYEEISERLRTEQDNISNNKKSDLEWHKANFEFLSKHQFYTDYAKSEFIENKELIKKRLQKKIKKLQKEVDTSLMEELGVAPEELKAMKKKLQKATGRPERGIETMFRLTSKNHLTLSAMADSKANIMISVNSIIISVLLGALMQKLDSNPHLIPPTVILLVVNLSSIVFSVLSLRPNVTSGVFKRQDIEDHKTNLLFFGNFHKVKRDDYHWGMKRLMENSSYLYSSLIDDIFFLGVVLAKKYRYLRTAYNMFMYGITVAVISFMVAQFYADTVW
ncbi:MAG: Pycsar system effector family protein [Bacteroidota bacterium]